MCLLIIAKIQKRKFYMIRSRRRDIRYFVTHFFCKIHDFDEFHLVNELPIQQQQQQIQLQQQQQQIYSRETKLPVVKSFEPNF